MATSALAVVALTLAWLTPLQIPGSAAALSPKGARLRLVDGGRFPLARCLDGSAPPCGGALDDSGCSYNGAAQPGGSCHCAPQWKGPQCAELNLIPTPREAVRTIKGSSHQLGRRRCDPAYEHTAVVGLIGLHASDVLCCAGLG